jgi:HAD superfamily hydrolase (TIGR01509 family)
MCRLMIQYAVIFDVDGTLIDSVDQHARAWQEAFAQFDLNIGFRKIRDQIGKGGDQLLPVFLSERRIRREGKQIEAARSAIFRIRYRNGLTPFPEVRELFLKFRAAGWKVAVASSAKKDELKFYERRCRIARLLDAQTSSDDVSRSKPYPDIFQAVSRKLREVAPEHCVVIGDSPYDAMAARKAGMHAVGFLCGGFGRKKLKAAGAEYLYRDASDLLLNFDRSIFNRHLAGEHL